MVHNVLASSVGNRSSEKKTNKLHIYLFEYDMIIHGENQKDLQKKLLEWTCYLSKFIQVQ